MIDYRIDLVKDWTDWVAVLAPLVGIGVTVYVAWLQHGISKRNTEIDERNLKFTLYHERKKIYDAIKTSLGEVMRDAAFKLDSYFTFLRETRDAQFLFGDDVNKEIELIRKNLIEIHSYRDRLENVPVGDERNKLVDDESKLLEWAGNEFDVLSKLFAKYLKID